MKIRFADRLAVLLCAAIIFGNVSSAPDVLAWAGERGQEMDVSGNDAPGEGLSVSGGDCQGSPDGGASGEDGLVGNSPDGGASGEDGPAGKRPDGEGLIEASPVADSFAGEDLRNSVSSGDCPVESDSGDGAALFAAEAPYTLEKTGISFSRAYQAMVLSPYGSYNCIDFDECAVDECDFVVGGKYVKAADMDIYYPNAASGTWGQVQFNGWQLLGYSILETSYGGELSTIRQYDPRTYSYNGKTYWLSEADAVISGTLSRDESVWGDDGYHGVEGGSYWFAEDGLLVVTGQFLSRPGLEVDTPAYQAGRILYSNPTAINAGIPENVRTICLDSTITEIGQWAFGHCPGLERVVADGVVTQIGDSAFFGDASLESVELKEGLVTISDRSFFNCTRLDIGQIPSTVTQIGARAFLGTAVKDIRIPDGVAEIEEYAFYDCNELERVDLNRVAAVGTNAFRACGKLELSEFPEGLCAVGDEAFYGCPGVVIGHLPESLTDENIGRNAFLVPYTVVHYVVDFDFGNGDGQIPANPEKVLRAAEYKQYYESGRTVADVLEGEHVQKKYAYLADGAVKYAYGVSYPSCESLTEEQAFENFAAAFAGRIPDPDPGNFVCLGYTPIQKYGEGGAYREYTFLGTGDREADAYHAGLSDKVEPSQTIYLYYRDAAKVRELTGITAEYTGGEVPVGNAVSKEDISVRASYAMVYESGKKDVFYRTIPAGDFEIEPGTAALGENRVTVSLSEQPYPAFPFPDLVLNVYEIDTVPEYLWGNVRPFYTPSGRRYLDDGNHGEEMQESLKEITKTAEVTVMGAARAEAGRRQTGIEASYPRLSQMEGTDVVQEDVAVYPIYTVEYNDGTKEEGVRGDAPLAPGEFETDRKTVGKGENRVTVTAGGFEDSFDVYGNHRDGIVAEYPRSEETEGTVLDKSDFTVFYTYTVMDPDSGRMSYRVPDRDSVVGSFALDKDRVSLGENVVVVTEKDDDAGWTDSVEITGTAAKEEPSPTPTPDPTPEPEPDPTPTPEPDPTPKPDPDPTPEPEPDPTPEPKPDPTPTLEPEPDPTPEPEPDPTPTSEPEPDPTPEPEPDPAPKPEPDPTPTPEPDPTPTSEPDPTSEPEPEATPIPEPASTPDPHPTAPKTGPCPKLKIALTAGGLSAVLTALGGFLLFLLLSRRRRRFCGILTDKEADGIRIKPYRETYELVQDVIDRSASLEECRRALQESGDFTYLPGDTSMSVQYTDRTGMPVRRDGEADEKAMYGLLEELEGCGRVEVALYDGNSFEIILVFHA